MMRLNGRSLSRAGENAGMPCNIADVCLRWMLQSTALERRGRGEW